MRIIMNNLPATNQKGARIMARSSAVSEPLIVPWPQGYGGIDAYRKIASLFAGCNPEDLTLVPSSPRCYVFVVNE